MLAHQGGWDEALFVAAPLVVFAWMLIVARRRAEAEARDERETGVEPGASVEQDRTDT